MRFSADLPIASLPNLSAPNFSAEPSSPAKTDASISRREESAFNVLKATLKNIVPEGSSFLLNLRVESIDMNALLTHNAMNRLDARRGDNLYALIRKEHVKIVQSG